MVASFFVLFWKEQNCWRGGHDRRKVEKSVLKLCFTGILRNMAIRMKEWNMLAQPAPAPHLPLQGIYGVSQAASVFGRGIADMAQGGAAFASARSTVARTGAIAALNKRLEQVSEETREEMQSREVRDWDYAWREASSPRLREVIEELPEEEREAGEALARAYDRRASLEARREHELQRVQRARSDWQERVDEAVERGDDSAALQWLEGGRGVFVPESQMESRRAEIQSRSRLSQWRDRLQREPLEALAAWRETNDESLLPPERRTAEALHRQVEEEARIQLAKRWQDGLSEGLAPDASSLELARRAGLISADRAALAREEPKPLSAFQLDSWIRRVDERGEDARENSLLRMEIATENMSVEQRAELLRRMDETAELAAGDRRALSRCVRDVYRTGGFGAPGDLSSVRRLTSLQREGVDVLRRCGPEEAARWMERARGVSNRWVCFND